MLGLAEKKISESMEAFKLYGRVEGRSRKTIQVYETAFSDVLDFINDIPLIEVAPGEIRRWIAARLDQGYAKATINIRLRVIRAFFNWLHCEGHLRENPLAQVKQLRVPRQYPYVLNELQVSALLRACHAQKGWTGKRNWAMLLTFLDAMLRLSELTALELADVSLQAHLDTGQTRQRR